MYRAYVINALGYLVFGSKKIGKTGEIERKKAPKPNFFQLEVEITASIRIKQRFLCMLKVYFLYLYLQSV